MNKLHILVVDDEAAARKKIRSYLQNSDHTITEAENGLQALEQIKSKPPDLIFLDIQMPRMTGFEVIEAVGVADMPPVIFVTAYDEFAIDAFEVQALDYLLKPFDEARFRKAFDRALNHLQQKNDRAALLNSLLQQVGKRKEFLQRLIVNEGERYFFVDCDAIVYLSAEEKYVKIHTMKESFLTRDTLSSLEQRLNPDSFRRIHRSHIINLNFVKEMQPWSHGDYVVLMKNGAELNFSRRYKDRLFGKK